MKKNWWKVLGVLILIYVFIAGMAVPLTPGISRVSPSSARTGEQLRLQVTGYNTQFTAGEGLQAWLKMDDERALSAQEVAVADDRQLELLFELPPYLPTGKKVQDFTLVLDSPHDGTSVLPSAVFVTQDSINPALGASVFPNTPIEGLHERWTFTFPFRNILYETIRNTYFHVALWFGMLFIFIGALTFSIRYLRAGNLEQDCRAQAFTKVGILFGVLGLATGAIWAKNTWGAYWSGDVKQNMTVIALLIYLAYFILRAVFDDPDKRARIAAVYNIFAFAALIPLIYVIPRLTDSLHPGAGGNPALGEKTSTIRCGWSFIPLLSAGRSSVFGWPISWPVWSASA